jgi:iron complex outermembrane receptor protein
MLSGNRRLRRGALLLAPASMALMVFAPTTAALAQTAASADDTEVGEVLVTARKREERLRDVPVAASVLDVESLQARGGVSDIQTLLATVPGLRYFNTSTPANSEISLRGAGTSRGTPAATWAAGISRPLTCSISGGSKCSAARRGR